MQKKSEILKNIACPGIYEAIFTQKNTKTGVDLSFDNRYKGHDKQIERMSDDLLNQVKKLVHDNKVHARMIFFRNR